jgi:predicted nucleic acid-binding protein
VLIQSLRGDEDVSARLERLLAKERSIATTPISIAEVLAGARKHEEAHTRVFLGAFECVRINRGVGEMAGGFVARYGASHGVELADALIAACAVVHQYPLWTLNRKHYPMKQVRLLTW